MIALITPSKLQPSTSSPLTAMSTSPMWISPPAAGPFSVTCEIRTPLYLAWGSLLCRCCVGGVCVMALLCVVCVYCVCVRACVCVCVLFIGGVLRGWVLPHVPAGTIAITGDAFRDRADAQVTLPATETVIADGGFGGARYKSYGALSGTSLREITLPPNLKIGRDAFNGCTRGRRGSQRSSGQMVCRCSVSHMGIVVQLPGGPGSHGRVGRGRRHHCWLGRGAPHCRRDPDPKHCARAVWSAQWTRVGMQCHGSFFQSLMMGGVLMAAVGWGGGGATAAEHTLSATPDFAP